MYNIVVMKKITILIAKISELQAKGLHGLELAEAMKENHDYIGVRIVSQFKYVSSTQLFRQHSLN